jgi:hypothetical protein
VWIEKARGAGPLQQQFNLPFVSLALEWLSDLDKMNALLSAIRGYPTDVNTRYTTYPRDFVLIHADFRLDNCFFDDDLGRCRMVDWATCSARHPIVDIAWILAETRLEVLEDPDQVRHLLQTYLLLVQESQKHFTMRDLLEALPLGVTYVIYTILIVNLALLDEATAKSMQTPLRGCNVLYQQFGVPKFAAEVSHERHVSKDNHVTSSASDAVPSDTLPKRPRRRSRNSV